MNKLYVFFIALFLTACTTAPNQKKTKNNSQSFKLQKASPNKAKVYIVYKNTEDQMVVGDVSYQVDQNSENIGKLFYGEYFSFEVEPGKRAIHWRGYGLNSQGVYQGKATFNFKPGKTYVFKQSHTTYYNKDIGGGLDLMSHLEQVKSKKQANNYLAQSKKSDLSRSCLKKVNISVSQKTCER